MVESPSPRPRPVVARVAREGPALELPMHPRAFASSPVIFGVVVTFLVGIGSVWAAT